MALFGASMDPESRQEEGWSSLQPLRRRCRHSVTQLRFCPPVTRLAGIGALGEAGEKRKRGAGGKRRR